MSQDPVHKAIDDATGSPDVIVEVLPTPATASAEEPVEDGQLPTDSATDFENEMLIGGVKSEPSKTDTEAEAAGTEVEDLPSSLPAAVLTAIAQCSLHRANLPGHCMQASGVDRQWHRGAC